MKVLKGLPSNKYTWVLVAITTLSLAVAICCAIALGLLMNRNGRFEGPDQREIIPKYMFDLPTSTLGIFQDAAVVTDAAPCAEIARDVLKENGTAVDAAIAALACNGVVHSHSMGLGGGFFMTIFKKSENKTYFLNARETAPKYFTENMFVNTTADSKRGVYSMGVPGEVLGYFKAKEKFGNPLITMKRLMEPAIRLCKNGITVSRSLRRALKKSETMIRNDSTLRKHFINEDRNQLLSEGDIHKRESLANTLRILSEEGSDAFYKGKLGRQIIDELQKLGSKMSMEDLMEYNVKWQNAQIAILSHGYKVYSSPPPGSGVIMASIMKIFDDLKFSSSQRSDGDVYLKLIEAFKFAFAQRSKIGDPFNSPYQDKIEKMTKEIVSNEWTKQISNKIMSMKQTSLDPNYYGVEQSTPEDDHGTGHISILASNGDAVSVTSTINLYFGAGIMSPSTGIIFNDQMDDFSTHPTKPNIYGIAPSKFNLIRPGARPVSSMSPTIITDPDDNVILVIGASGGPRIISAVAYTTIQHLVFQQNIKEAIDFPRIHHQLLPMKVYLEVGFSQNITRQMEQFGHNVIIFDPYYGKGYIGARVQAVAVDQNNSIITVNNDRRKSGGVAGY